MGFLSNLGLRKPATAQPAMTAQIDAHAVKTDEGISNHTRDMKTAYSVVSAVDDMIEWCNDTCEFTEGETLSLALD